MLHWFVLFFFHFFFADFHLIFNFSFDIQSYEILKMMPLFCGVCCDWLVSFFHVFFISFSLIPCLLFSTHGWVWIQYACSMLYGLSTYTHVGIQIWTFFKFSWINLKVFRYSSPALCIEVVKRTPFCLTMFFVMRYETGYACYPHLLFCVISPISAMSMEIKFNLDLHWKNNNNNSWTCVALTIQPPQPIA